LLTPINDDDSIAFSKLSDEIDYLTGAGVDGIYSNGTAGEFYAQSEAEFDRINQMLAEKCERARMPFQIGASFMSAQIALERAKRAAQLKPSAVQITLPDWSPVTLEEAIAFLQRIAEAVAPVPLVLYNPPHAKRVLQPREFAALCEAVPQLVGVKVAGGDAQWYAAMQPLLARLSVFVPGHLLASGFAHGAHGAYSNVACLNPRGAKRWNELMKTDLAAALEIEERIHQFMNDYILPFREKDGASNQALDKLLAAVGDWAQIGTRLRWPYRGIEEAKAAALRPIARRMLPELFEESFMSLDNAPQR
jgi:dihydrodipicolinate synthase/N-acetylneuraminate lyase